MLLLVAVITGRWWLGEEESAIILWHRWGSLRKLGGKKTARIYLLEWWRTTAKKKSSSSSTSPPFFLYFFPLRRSISRKTKQNKIKEKNNASKPSPKRTHNSSTGINNGEKAPITTFIQEDKFVVSAHTEHRKEKKRELQQQASLTFPRLKSSRSTPVWPPLSLTIGAQCTQKDRETLNLKIAQI